MSTTTSHEGPPGKVLIFRPWRKCSKTGRILWARSFGKRAWPLWVDPPDAS